MNVWNEFSVLALAGLLVVATFVLGAAIQYGTTCAVRAVSELIRHRRADLFLGFFECGLWALLVAWWLTPEMAVPQWRALGWLCSGAALFGVGATINGGCAFGSIARLGEGRLEFLLTGVGAYVSFRLLEALGHETAFLDQRDPLPHYALLIVLFGLPALFIVRLILSHRPFWVILRLSVLMGVIGSMGAFVGFLHQPWPWMLALQLIGMSNWLTMLSLFGLISGSVVNGILRGRFHFAPSKLTTLRDKFSGGFLMGAASSLVPGGNDSLILQGIPAGSSSAFLGYGAMIVAIFGVLWVFPRLNIH